MLPPGSDFLLETFAEQIKWNKENETKKTAAIRRTAAVFFQWGVGEWCIEGLPESLRTITALLFIVFWTANLIFSNPETAFDSVPKLFEGPL